MEAEIHVKTGYLIEIPQNVKYTYNGNMKMLEIIPNPFERLNIQEEKRFNI